MNKTKTRNNHYLDELKSNYRQRIHELELSSKNFSSNSYDFRSEFLTGMLDISQYYIDLQKKFTGTYPTWYDDDYMIQLSKVITEIWIHNVRNMDLFYSMFLDHTRNNMRITNKTVLQIMQAVEKFYDMYDIDLPIQKNMLIEIIKEVKRHNDDYLQNQLPKKDLLKSNKHTPKVMTTE